MISVPCFGSFFICFKVLLSTMLEFGRKGNSIWLSSAPTNWDLDGMWHILGRFSSPFELGSPCCLESRLQGFLAADGISWVPLWDCSAQACEYSCNRSCFQSASALTMPHPNAVHILMQIKGHCNIRFLVLAGFTSETTDFILTPRQAGKEWNSWWPCFPKGFIYLTLWCLFDLNIYPSFETLGEKRFLNYLLSPMRRAHKYLSLSFPSGCPENMILIL